MGLHSFKTHLRIDRDPKCMMSRILMRNSCSVDELNG